MGNVSTRLSATSAFLTLVFFLSSVTLAQEKPVFETRPYKDGVKITDYKGDIGKKLVIPETIDGRPVRGIGLNAFSNSGSLTRVELPEGLETLEISAFRCCKRLESVVLPRELKTIELAAFKECESLVSVNLPRGLQSIEDSAFSGCASLKSVNLPRGLQSIGDSAFSGCASLKSVDLPEGLKTIENETFAGCNSLVSVALPKGLQTIGNSAFSGCASLRSVDLPEGLQTIGNSAFSECASLRSVDFHIGLKTIGNSAFSGCASLKSVDLPEGLRELGSNAFWDCKSLESVKFPGELRKIGECAFDGCSFAKYSAPEGSWAVEWISENRPRSFKKDDANEVASNDSPTFITRLCKDGVEITDYEGSVSETLIVPEKIDGLPVRKIGFKAFQECESLTDVELPEGLETIGTSAFRGCKLLENVRLPGGLKTIEPCAFYGCSSLANVELPEGLETIGEFAFCSCLQFRSVELPEGLKTIGYHAFARCNFDVVRLPSSLETIGGGWNCAGFNLPEDNPRFRTLDGVLFDNEIKTLLVYPGKKTGNDYLVPEGVETIGDAAFSGCKSLITIVFPESLQTIGKNAFWDCESLKSVEFPESLKTIGDWAFCCCLSLRKVVFPKSLRTIGTKAFSDCATLAKVELPAGLQKIGTNAFEGCPSIELTATEGSWAAEWLKERRPDATMKVADPSDVKYLVLPGNQAFKTRPFQDGVEITGRRKEFGETLIIPEEIDGQPVRYIGPFAFYGCKSLASVELPESLQGIGYVAFPDGVEFTAPKNSWAAEWIENNDVKKPLFRPRNIFFASVLAALFIWKFLFSAASSRKKGSSSVVFSKE